ncbi:MAG: tetrapyrrole methylase family protein/MazG family protein [Planctomycetota bacterium]|jgi:tetrapyrrole methylase family protein/MazG family protein
MSDERLVNSIQDLSKVMKRLRQDCPWDRRQTHSSLRRYLLEECYEVLDCLDRGDDQALKGELGDLLFQIWFHCEMANENEAGFDLSDVVTGVTEKLVRRHPHVFESGEGVDEVWVKKNWQELKMAEGRRSILEGVPIGMPSLQVAHALQEKAAHVGFDWPNYRDVLEKVKEELDEFLVEQEKDEQSAVDGAPDVRGEFGDLLFSLVNVGRWLRVSPEDALRETNIKFRRRFLHIEDSARTAGKKLDDMTLDEMDALWDEAKTLE